MRARGDRSSRGTGIVAWFALVSLVVFLLIGVGMTYWRTRDVRAREERAAASRAELVAGQVIGPMLTPADLKAPLTGDRYQAVLDQFESLKKTQPGMVRVKIWGTDGQVLFSDDLTQVGTRPGIDEELGEALHGTLANEVSDLSHAENVSERKLASKLFETYVPYRASPTGPVLGAIEVYQDYSIIQAEVDRLVRVLSVSLVAGLLALYGLILPLMFGVTRTLRRQNAQLQEQATQLSDLLEREQETVAELRELDRLKSDFVAAASHELRTPLTAIRGYVHVLRTVGAGNDETGQEALAAIERQSGRLERLVRNVLREGRLEQGDVVQEVELFDFGALVREVRKDFHDVASRIVDQVPHGMAEVVCDRRRTQEILTNLIDNALKYSPRTETVTVGASVDDRMLTFWVRDRGPGIAEEEIPRIFERFYQSDQSATREHGGVGLGLHIVRGLVHGMGGSINVESVVGTGTTFTVSLPLSTPDDISAPDDAGVVAR